LLFLYFLKSERCQQDEENLPRRLREPIKGLKGGCKENTGQRAEWQVLVLTQTASLAGPQLQATAQQAYTVGHVQP